MTTLIASSSTIDGLEKLINKFYLSENYFINNENQAENKKTGKKLGIVKNVKNRYKYYV